jgi:hypothetical protein
MTTMTTETPIATAAPRSTHGRRILLSLAGVGLVLAATVGTVAAASPAPNAGAQDHKFCVAQWAAAAANRTVDTLRAVGDCEIDRRITTLDELNTRVTGSKAISDPHKAQLQHSGPNPVNYDAEKAGLTALKAQIDGETDLQALRADIEKIAPEFRVYLLVVPKTHLTDAADAGSLAVGKLDELAVKLQGLIDKAAAKGKDVTQANALLADMKAKTGQAGALIAPIVGSLMPVSAADYNAGPGKTAIENARTAAKQARDLLKAARADAKQIIDLLKA